MKHFSKNMVKVFFALLVALIISTPPQAQTNVPQVSVEYQKAPLFKRLADNAAMRIRVYVPPGRIVTYSELHIQIDAAAVNAVEMIEVKQNENGVEHFVSKLAPLAVATPQNENLSIPFVLNCKPGLTYLWVNIKIKAGADIDQKIRIKPVALKTGNNTKHNISGDHHNALYRLGVAVRKAGDDNVHTYRIPGIVVTDRGTLISVYDNRYRNSSDLPEDIDVGMSRSTDGGHSWEPMKVVMDMGAPHENNGVGDPAILFDPVTKKIWIAALWSKGNRSIAGSKPGLSPDTTGQFVLVSSDDDGITWSEPYNITPQVKDPKWHLYFNGPGSGIAMKNGTLVFASQYWDENRMPYSSIIYSQDHGKSWKSGTGAKSNTTESQVIETRPGTLMLNMRDNRGGYRSVATSTNLGKTWVEHHTSQQALPDPVCMAGFIKASALVKNKRAEVVLFSNVANRYSRRNMTIKASYNLGESWPGNNQVHIDERLGFGYSSLVMINDQTVGLLYEGERSLYFVRVAINEIPGNQNK